MRANKVVDSISEHLEHLPGNMQAEVLDFVKHLEAKRLTQEVESERKEWFQISLENSLKGMETGEVEYFPEDLKERFQ